MHSTGGHILKPLYCFYPVQIQTIISINLSGSHLSKDKAQPSTNRLWIGDPEKAIISEPIYSDVLNSITSCMVLSYQPCLAVASTGGLRWEQLYRSPGQCHSLWEVPIGFLYIIVQTQVNIQALWAAGNLEVSGLTCVCVLLTGGQCCGFLASVSLRAYCSEVGWAAGKQLIQLTQMLWPGSLLESLMGEVKHYS